MDSVTSTQPPVMDSVTTKRGAALPSSSDDSSFAPAQFQFTAPSNLQEFFPKFTPLSPESTAQFLMPTGGASVATSRDDSRCVTHRRPIGCC